MKAFILALLVVAQATSIEGATCAECVTAYEAAIATNSADNALMCGDLKTFLTCLVDATSCPLAAAKAGAITTNFAAFTGACVLNDVCTCQKDYFATDMSGGDAAICTATTAYYHCLTGKTNLACDGTSAVSVLAAAVEGAIPGTCSEKTATCDCQIAYTKADVSDDPKKCTEVTTYFNCLTGQTTAACDGSETVSDLATAIESEIPGTCAAKTDTCDCQIAYTKADISDAAKTCTETTAYYHCLTGKTAAACDGSGTVKTLADAIHSALPGSCSSSEQTDTCDCQIAYTRADISDDVKKCTAVTTYYNCLTGKTTAACDGSATVSTIATAIETEIPGTCAEKTSTCDCQIAFAKADISDDPKKCIAITAYYHCLTGKTTAACDGAGTVKTLADAINGAIPGTCAEKTTLCDCQIAYTRADISDDAKKCTETTTLYHCITGKTTAACDGSSTVSDVATAVESNIPSTCAEKTDTCACQIAYTKGDISTDAKKCTVGKDFVSCLVGKNTAGCDTSVTVKTLATDANTILTGLSSCAKYLGIRKLRSPRAYYKDKTDVCVCEVAYATADISTNLLRCSETKTLTSCIQTSINDGCGASTTKTNVGTAAQAAFTDLTAGVCALTSTCQCQVDFNKADVTPSKKCTAGTALDTCLTGISTTTEVGCNGTVTAADLTPDMKTRVKDVLCSAAGLKSSIMISLLMLTISALFASP